jgi:hypothetical protein
MPAHAIDFSADGRRDSKVLHELYVMTALPRTYLLPAQALFAIARPVVSKDDLLDSGVRAPGHAYNRADGIAILA